MKNKSPFLPIILNSTGVTLILYIVTLFFKPVETGDIWWHLKIGEFISAHKYVPVIDPFPFANEQSLWVLTQWLGSCVYYFVFQWSGLFGLQVFRVFLFLLVVFIFIRYASKKIPSALMLVLSFVLILVLHSRAHLRPFVFNFIFIQIFLSALFQYRETHRFTSLLPIFFAGIIWINTHLGSFMYGLSLIGIFVLSSLIEQFKSSPDQKGDSGGQKNLFYGYLIIFILFSLSFLFNPYGLNGALHPLKTIFIEDYINFNFLGNTVGELQPPVNFFSWQYFWIIPVIIFAGLALSFDKQNCFRNTLLIVVSFFLFMYGRRANVFFALVVLYTFVDSCRSIKFDKFPFFKTIQFMVLLAINIFIVVFLWGKVQEKIFVRGKIHGHFQLTEDINSPLQSLVFLEKQGFKGNIFNDDIYGGYILWRNYPRFHPFTDTRQINLSANQFYNAILSNPEKYWPQLAVMYNFKAVLLNANKLNNRRAIIYFLNNPDWELQLIEADRVLFTQKLMQSRMYGETLQQSDEQLPLYTEALKTKLGEGIRDEINYIYMEPVAQAVTLFELGFRGAALKKMLYSFEIANTPYQHNMARLMLNQLNR